MFKHGPTQEVAYNSLLIERRKQLHRRVGQAIEVTFADHLDDHLSQLARHYSHSDNADKAIEFLWRAGRQWVERSAHADAIAVLTEAIDLLLTLPDSPERRRRELPLQMALGQALIPSKMWAAPEAGGPSRERKRFASSSETRRSFFPCCWAPIGPSRAGPGSTSARDWVRFAAAGADCERSSAAADEKRQRFLSPEELQRVNAALIEETDWRWRAYFPLALMLGTRRSELLAMRWTDIDLAARTWRIPETKAGNSHLLPLPNPAIAVLESLPSRVEGEWVFPGVGKRPPGRTQKSVATNL